MIINTANCVKYNYICDDDGIDNVMQRLWKFANFASKHTVGIAGDDIMYYILVGLGARTFPAKLQQNYDQQSKTQGWADF